MANQSVSLDLFDRRVAQILLAAGLLVISELGWLTSQAATLTLARALLVVLAAIAQVLVATVVVNALAFCFRRLHRRRATVSLLFSIAALPLAVWASQSLFSGRFIRTVPGVGVYRVVFGLALLLAVWLVATTFQSEALRRRLAARRLALGASGSGILTLSYADTHLFLDLYPAFHFILWAGLLTCASFAAHLAVPEDFTFSNWIRTPAAVLIGASLPLLAMAWASPAANYLATYSDGTYPKLRELMALVVPDTQPDSLPVPRVASVTEPVDPTQAAEDPWSEPTPESQESDAPEAGPVSPPQSTEDTELERIRARVRNVVFVLIDSFRADHVGKIVDGDSLTPHLDRLRQESIYFETAYAPSALTERSMPSLMTSFAVPVVREVSRYGVHVRSWLDALRAGGYRTFANGICRHSNREEMHLRLSECFGAEEIGTAAHGAPHGLLLGEALAFITQTETDPFAVYTHWLEPHNQKAEQYLAAVRGVDERVGELVNSLKSMGHWDDTLLIVTADHGIHLGERMRRGNVCCPEIQVRVPMWVRIPGSRFTGTTVDALVSTIEVPGTIVDLLGARDHMPLDSPGLVDRLYGPSRAQAGSDDLVYAELYDMKMIRQGTIKGVLNTRRDTLMVYDVEKDPREENPIEGTERLAAMRRLFAEQGRRHQEEVLTLVGVGGTGISDDVLTATLSHDFDEESMAELLAGLWERDSETRRFLLKQVFEKRMVSVRGLDTLVRDTFEADDQLLLVTRVYANRPGACEELQARVSSMTVPGRVWLAEFLSELPADCVRALSGALEQQLIEGSQSPPEPGSEADRARVLTVHGLIVHLGKDATVELKSLAVETYNRLAANRTQLETMRGANFSRRDMIRALKPALAADSVELLPHLTVTSESALFVAQFCTTHESERCREVLKGMIESAKHPGFLHELFRHLHASGDTSMLAEAEAAFRSRFPDTELP